MFEGAEAVELLCCFPSHDGKLPPIRPSW